VTLRETQQRSNPGRNDRQATGNQEAKAAGVEVVEVPAAGGPGHGGRGGGAGHDTPGVASEHDATGGVDGLVLHFGPGEVRM